MAQGSSVVPQQILDFRVRNKAIPKFFRHISPLFPKDWKVW